MQKSIQILPMSRMSHTSSTKTAAVNPAYMKVNRAYSQSRPCGILFALANGKLYFEHPETFRDAQNHLPHKGEGRYSEVMRPLVKINN
jgi:hypothetical protein